MKTIYHPPTKFCVFPALGYWSLNGKPVSDKEANYGLTPGVKWLPTEIARNLKDYMGWLEEVEE